MKHGLFSATSNIDGHWARTEGVGEERTYECHGSVTYMQCVQDTDGRIWRTDPDEIAQIKVPAWDLSAGDKVEVVEGDVHKGLTGEDSWVPAVMAADGCGVVDPASGKSLTVRAVRRPGGFDLTRAAADSPLPQCAETGQAARPNVLMFGDWQVNCARIDAGQERLMAWEQGLPPDVRLVVVEVGAGTAVPSIRNLAERTAAEYAKSVLVRINLDQSEVPPSLGPRGIAVGGLGALDALSQIDALI